MKDEGRRVKGMSKREIRELAKMIRKKCGLDRTYNVPVCHFFEWIMEKLFPDFEWEIVPDYTMTEEGVTFSGAKKIEIRQDVYVAACNGDGRARFTIMHEVGHFILHGPNRIALCRLSPGENISKFEDPEWQADAFGGELLMYYPLIKNLSTNEIAEKCGVTPRAARVQKSKT